jgi:non-ribosomal peptide synthetase component F
MRYWKKQLKGVKRVELATDRERPKVASYRGAIESVEIGEEVSRGIRELSRGEGVTVFMTMLAGFKVLLCYLTGQTDIAVGSNNANRNRAEIEGLIGFFINQLMLRSSLSGNPTFREILARVRKVVLGAQAHQDLPFNIVLQFLKPNRRLSRHPLFQIKVDFQSQTRPSLNLSGLRVIPFVVGSENVHFDLNLSLEDTDRQLFSFIEYRMDLFEADTIKRVQYLYKRLLGLVIKQADTGLDALVDALIEMDREMQLEKEGELEQVSLSMLDKIKQRKALLDRNALVELTFGT